MALLGSGLLGGLRETSTPWGMCDGKATFAARIGPAMMGHHRLGSSYGKYDRTTTSRNKY